MGQTLEAERNPVAVARRRTEKQEAGREEWFFVLRALLAEPQPQPLSRGRKGGWSLTACTEGSRISAFSDKSSYLPPC